ncbi:uncharacterized protein LOC120627453 [Pararge aegeria]|uniref:uncharacterized protein LOC120627453 n=1 Tax=Pararge aegeria TaxID=116150 RepID=UPI0019CF7257|nr:uncharacterized protein LOC120627453 [Pararge aegeria]
MILAVGVEEGQRRSTPPRLHEPNADCLPALSPPRLRPVTATVAEQQRSVVEGRESAMQSSPGRPVSAMTDRDASGTDRIIEAIRSINTTVQTMMTIWSPRLSKLPGATMCLVNVLRSPCPTALRASSSMRQRSTRTSSSQERPCWRNRHNTSSWRGQRVVVVLETIKGGARFIRENLRVPSTSLRGTPVRLESQPAHFCFCCKLDL